MTKDSMVHPWLIRKFYKLTAHDDKIPTDNQLDYDIEMLNDYMRVIRPLRKRIFLRKARLILKHKKYVFFYRILFPILIAASIITVWKLTLEPFVVIQKVPVEIIDENGIKINTTNIVIPAERSELTKDNLDYFAALFDIKNWYEVRQQAMLESGNFTSDVCVNGHNLFGMRLPGQRETTAIGEYKNHAEYKHWVYSLYDYKIWQETRMRHLPLLKGETYYQWLVRIHYAEDETYTNKLKTVKWY